MVMLVTIGPALTIVGRPVDMFEGDAQSITFTTYGATGFVFLSLPTSTIPTADWTFTDNADGTATLSTGDAATPGDYAFTVRALDATRQPVTATYSLRVIAVAPAVDYLLLETGDFLLLESGDKIILD